MKHTTIISLVATASLFLVLLSLSGVSIWTALLNQQAIKDVKTAAIGNDLYAQLDHALAQGEAIQRAYMLTPTFTGRVAYQANSKTISGLFDLLEKNSSPPDTSVIGHISMEQQRYQLSSRQLFATIDAADLTSARTLLTKEVDPLFKRIMGDISQQETREKAKAVRDLTQLLQVQNVAVTTTPLVFAMGVLLIGVSFYSSRVYRRRIEETAQAEITLLEGIVSTDPLTGLGNQYAYQEKLSRLVEEAHLNEDMVVVALIDVDDFKAINDEGGYQRGDDVLMMLASVLHEANISDILFRLSGDDFALILSHMSLAASMLALEGLRSAIEHHPLGVTVSIGIAHTVSEALGHELLSAQALATLQEAKRRGRNRVLTFDAIEKSVRLLSPAKTKAVRRLLSEGKLSIAFQPIWNISTGTLLAFEALARPAAASGFTGPQDMFDIAEQMGRAHELDIVCLHSIFARTANFPPDVLLFINLTPQTLVHDLLTGAILLEAVTAAGLEPSRVVLEITERSIVDLAEVVEKAKLLQGLGFQIALDDAGAGNSGLEMLSQLSLHYVKIDRAIVSNALTDQAARSVFAGIITIASESHFAIIAEGIETPAMLAFVRQAGVQLVQGYLLGRPSETIPEISTLHWLSQKAPTFQG